MQLPLPSIFNIQEFSIFKYEPGGPGNKKSGNPAKSGGGIVAAIIPATAEAPGFVTLPDRDSSNFLTWGFHIKIINVTDSVIAVEEINTRFYGRGGLGAETFSPGIVRRLTSEYDTTTKDIISYPLLLKPQEDHSFKVELILSSYHQYFRFFKEPFYAGEDDFGNPELYEDLRESADVTIRTNQGRVRMKV
jgi:hypothetical protein